MKIFLAPVASLKITVVLFLMSIFIVFAGTLAQTEKDIWQVVHDYFRMDLSFAPDGTGFGLGLDRFSNLLSAVVLSPHGTDSLGHWVLVPQWLADWFVHVREPDGGSLDSISQSRQRQATDGRYRHRAGGHCLDGRRDLAGLAPDGDAVEAVHRVAFPADPVAADPVHRRSVWYCWSDCVLVFRKRAGIVLLHSGVGLLMLGELLVGVSAVEGQMQIIEGQTSNVVMDTRELELAIIDRSDKTEDERGGHSSVASASRAW